MLSPCVCLLSDLSLAKATFKIDVCMHMKHTHLYIFIFLLIYKIVYFDDLHFMNAIELHGSYYYILRMKIKLAHIEFEKS